MVVLRISVVLACLAPAAVAGQSPPDFQKSVQASMQASLEKQRASIQKQASLALNSVVNPAPAEPAASFYTVPWPAPMKTGAAMAGYTDCDPMPKPELDKMVEAASSREGVDPELVRLVIGKESAARACALSPKGAQGLMQLMPATADELGVADPFDARQNVEGGTRLLKRLLTKYDGDLALALGAYNAGSGRVDRDGGVPNIPETINYISDILGRFRQE